MNRCENCKIEVLDPSNECPFCHMIIGEEQFDKKPMYPELRGGVRKFRAFQNIFFFVSIVLGWMMVYANYRLEDEYWWSLVGVLVLVYANMFLHITLRGTSGYMVKILTLIIAAVCVLVGVDYLMGNRGWAVNWVIPVVCLLIDVAILIMIIVNRKNWQSYMMAEIMMCILSLIPLVLGYMGYISSRTLGMLPEAVSVFLFLGTLIIGDRKAKEELKRRFHV